MVVIAISDDLGTPSGTVAYRLSRLLNTAYLVENSAELTKGEEDMPAPEAFRLAGGLGRWARSLHPSRRFPNLRVRVLEAASSANVVIRGARVPAILREFGHVLRVHLWSTDEARLRSVMNCYGIDDRLAALELIEIADADARIFGDGSDMMDCRMDACHIVLNAELIGVDQCVEQICQLASSGIFRPSLASTKALTKRLEEARRALSHVAMRHSAGEMDDPDPHRTLADLLARAEAALYGWSEVQVGTRDAFWTGLQPCWD